MKPGLLEAAARSLRERTVPEEGDGEQTLARVVSVVRQRARRRRLVTLIAMQAAIGGVGVGAWAATTGRLEALLAAIRPAPAAAPAPAPDRRPPPRRPAPVAPETSAPPPPAPPPRPPVRRVAAVAPAPTPERRPDEDALYRQAHEAHFVRRDFPSALAAWNRYLALERPGRLALEARYNRAIALYRLGQLDEAAQALRPFAGGDYGPYRQQEARALLRRLARPPP